MGLIAIGAGIAVFTGVGSRYRNGYCCRQGLQNRWQRQPEASGKINGALILGLSLAESTAIYGFVISILMLFTLNG